MNAEDIARALDGQKGGGRWWRLRCPAHQGQSRSMAICDGDRAPLVRCYAGCAPGAIIAALRARGLWPDRVPEASLGGRRAALSLAAQRHAHMVLLIAEADRESGRNRDWTLGDADAIRAAERLTEGRAAPSPGEPWSMDGRELMLQQLERWAGSPDWPGWRERRDGSYS